MSSDNTAPTFEALPNKVVFKHRLMNPAKNHLSSPTDNIMSPCTQKLVAQRNSKIQTFKPRSLSNSFAEVAQGKDGEQ
ncbi:hypothetical protein K493DRAFT_313985 [Basidiobolus meristosporus CBS 931.73]|uniref:Uncharacterized protein n=1 Tax=Basidiobolus meristosporus CBS 931.73 TaxID=1314790 RepID=A0A1Y1YI44_9FUNG|nr:hypothetical protein K493DRAFT_313985 [Basidiobolus meristosporus CBS 931.73]|eukprot:ORX97649.1 hypothetical protein K493DRAFT_313985 [Basidiobolus meristosporus CBS 931.73]